MINKYVLQSLTRNSKRCRPKCLKEHATALLLLASLLAVRGITNVANLTNELVEAVLDIDAKLGRRLEKRNAPRAGKVLALGLGDLAAVL